MLGWTFIEKGDYKVNYPRLSSSEDKLVELLLEVLLEEPVSEEGLLKLFKRECEELNLVVEKKAAERVLKVAKSRAFGFGIFDALLADDSLEEISVVGIGSSPIRVYVRKVGWKDTNCLVSSQEFLQNVVNKMSRSLGRRLTLQNPRLNAVLPDGSRLHATISPVAVDGFELTIRKFKKNPLTVNDFVGSEIIPAKVAAFLSLALESDSSLIVAGNTGSGKTSLLNALFSFIPTSERIVIVEESPEINIPHPHKIRLVVSDSLGVGLNDLVEDTLRMRPDRVIVGEVRSQKEISALFDSLLAGQAKGCYATFHADSAEEALYRLKSAGIPQENLSAIDLILVLKRMSFEGSEVRRLVELCEVSEGKTRNIFSYGRTLKTHDFTGLKTVEKICLARNLPIKNFSSLLTKTEKQFELRFVESNSNSNKFSSKVHLV